MPGLGHDFRSRPLLTPGGLVPRWSPAPVTAQRSHLPMAHAWWSRPISSSRSELSGRRLHRQLELRLKNELFFPAARFTLLIHSRCCARAAKRTERYYAVAARNAAGPLHTSSSRSVERWPRLPLGGRSSCGSTPLPSRARQLAGSPVQTEGLRCGGQFAPSHPSSLVMRVVQSGDGLDSPGRSVQLQDAAGHPGSSSSDRRPAAGLRGGGLSDWPVHREYFRFKQCLNMICGVQCENDKSISPIDSAQPTMAHDADTDSDLARPPDGKHPSARNATPAMLLRSAARQAHRQPCCGAPWS
jgi:hypothetical protein